MKTNFNLEVKINISCTHDDLNFNICMGYLDDYDRSELFRIKYENVIYEAVQKYVSENFPVGTSLSAVHHRIFNMGMTEKMLQDAIFYALENEIYEINRMSDYEVKTLLGKIKLVEKLRK